LTTKRDLTYQRILDAAERLFAEHGLAAITLQDIARAVRMRHASLYYYAPKGKEQLYVEVTQRGFQRHGDGLVAAIATGGEFRSQMYAVAEWFASHAPIDLGRIVRSELPTLDPADAQRLIDFSLAALRTPIASAIREAVSQGIITVNDPEFAAMGLVGLVQSVHNIPHQFLPTEQARIAAAHDAVDMVLFGWVRRA